MDAIFYVWLGIIVTAAVVESLTTDLISVWFIGGGIVALILELCGVPEPWQVIVFLLVALGLLVCLRTPLKKKLDKQTVLTNADSLVGLQCTMRKETSFECPGEVKVRDVIWTAIAENEKTEIAAGTLVTVVAIKGNKLIVKVAEEE